MCKNLCVKNLSYFQFFAEQMISYLQLLYHVYGKLYYLINNSINSVQFLESTEAMLYLSFVIQKTKTVTF